jgi:hypothetical protein
MTRTSRHRYRATESKYKGGAEEVYVTYNLALKACSWEPNVLPPFSCHPLRPD